jgi:tetratricopeptide (TPR) repeat protein
MNEARAAAAMRPTPRDARFDGLTASAARRVIEAEQALALGRADTLTQRLTGLLAVHPDHPEVLRLEAGLHFLQGDFPGAITAMQRVVAQRPNDAGYLSSLGSALLEAARYDEAIDVLRRACEIAPDFNSAWYNLGLAYARSMRPADAVPALQRAAAKSPEFAVNARVVLGDIFRAENRIDEAIAEYRSVIAIRKNAGMAWWGLAEIKTRKLSDSDVAQLRAAMNMPGSVDDVSTLGFALARALEDRGLYAESLAALENANARVRAFRRWDAAAFTAHVDEILKAFAPPPAGAPDAQLGREVIFVVSLPRSGSTLTEQVLAAHSQVDGGGELPDLPAVLTEESQRRGKSFPDFVADLTPADWERMGRRYLERTARWRRNRPRFTDKMPSNWMYVGAIRAMLPGARIIVVRRDPLETCLSCYRQRFANIEYTRSFQDLGAAWRDFDRTVTRWRELHPTHVHESVYEKLVADPETVIRDLLAYCELPFEPACLEFHKSERQVHTPSATQVRQPLRADTARAHRYGALLDPLRRALGLSPFSA